MTTSINKVTNQESFNDLLESIVEAQQEYFETHTDYGSGLFECVSESYFDDRLESFLDNSEIDLKGMEIESLSLLILDFLDYSPSHQFDTVKSDVFFVDSHELVELEINIPFKEIDISLADFLSYSKDCGYCIRHQGKEDSFKVYVCTDVIWNATIDKAMIEQLIEENHDHD